MIGPSKLCVNRLLKRGYEIVGENATHLILKSKARKRTVVIPRNSVDGPRCYYDNIFVQAKIKPRLRRINYDNEKDLLSWPFYTY